VYVAGRQVKWPHHVSLLKPLICMVKLVWDHAMINQLLLLLYTLAE
jgi:hypothetical protein